VVAGVLGRAAVTSIGSGTFTSTSPSTLK